MPFLQLFSSDTHYVHDVIFSKFLAFFSLATWHGTFVQFPPPLKGNWCLHHALHFLCFFVDIMWDFFMASWACSMSDSFTQDASIGWYPFHLTKYSHYHPLNCLDLNTTSTSNSSSLSMRSGGGLELYSQLGREASWTIDFRSQTWNMGWTLRFSNNSSL
jgi:hypothetical protein